MFNRLTGYFSPVLVVVLVADASHFGAWAIATFADVCVSYEIDKEDRVSNEQKQRLIGLIKAQPSDVDPAKVRTAQTE